MSNEFYKAGIREALEKLIEANNSLFDGAVSILLRGELKNWSDSVPEGEVHTFEFPVIKNAEDGNVQMLVELMETIEAIYEKLCNVNGIEKEER